VLEVGSAAARNWWQEQGIDGGPQAGRALGIKIPSFFAGAELLQ